MLHAGCASLCDNQEDGVLYQGKCGTVKVSFIQILNTFSEKFSLFCHQNTKTKFDKIQIQPFYGLNDFFFLGKQSSKLF